MNTIINQVESFDFSSKPTADQLMGSLKKNGIFILSNLFTPEAIMLLQEEFNKIFLDKKELYYIDDKEGCSRDIRIEYANKYSKLYQTAFCENSFFNNLCLSYTGQLGERKTMLNFLSYAEGEIRNSGAGWHRDNHDAQFKVITYLTDVSTENGNFQWLTNSSKRHIGFPTPRTQDYNTRYTDSTINLLLENDNCEIVDITGPAGTTIIADTTYIHRGNIINKGIRKAVTQYFFR